MNAALEQGLRAYIAEELEADDVVIGEGDEAITVLGAQVGSAHVSLHCNIAGDTMPRDRSLVIIAVPEAPRIVGTLHTASVMVSVSTPSDVAGITEADHRAIIAAVRALFPDMPSLYNARAQASTPEQVTLTQAALDAGLALVAACAAELVTSAAVTISDTSPWFADSMRDGVLKEQKRWESILALRMAVNG
jgi:hypothetical protein